MNERIDEIYQKSFSTYQVGVGFGDARFVERFDLRKFAKLLVLECCDIFVDLRTRPADLAVKDVKKHFGVEE